MVLARITSNTVAVSVQLLVLAAQVFMASAAVRAAVAAAADSLQQRPASRPLDEKLGSKDWRRLRTEWFAEAAACGPDWTAALSFLGNIAPAADYTDDLVLLDSDAGAPGPLLKHVRQGALLAWLRRSLPTDSESYRLIRQCVHAGGRLGAEGAADGTPQALYILDERWRDAERIDEDPGAEADDLFAMRWPGRVSVDDYTSHYNKVVSKH